MSEPYPDGVAVDIIENEGLGYAVTSYCPGSAFENPKTAELWTAAAEALDALEKHLRRSTGRDF